MSETQTQTRYKDPDRQEKIFARISAAPEGQDTVAFLEQEKIDIWFVPPRASHQDTQNGSQQKEEEKGCEVSSTVTIDRLEGGVYYYAGGFIEANPGRSDANLSQAMFHEAQHLRQHFAGVGNADRILTDEDEKIFRQIQEADAQATSVEDCFRLLLLGDDAPFRKAGAVGYEEMCSAYMRAYEKDPDSIYDGRAKRAAFEAWFETDSHVAYYNRNTEESQIPFLKKMRELYPGHGLSEGPLESAWVNRIGDLSAVNYFALPGQEDVLTFVRRRNAELLTQATPRPRPAAIESRAAAF